MSEILIDLADRWRRARRAALVATLALPSAAEDDGESLARALRHDRQNALRRVFDNSLRLGASFTRYWGAEIALVDLPSTLPQLGAPCLVGCFRRCEHEPAIFVEGHGCDAGAPRGPLCQRT